MGNDIYKKAIKHLPMFFDTQLLLDPLGAGIFEPLRNIIEFNQAYIFFLNPDNIELKYLFGKDRRYKVGDTFNIDEKIKNNLLSKISTDSIVKLLNIEEEKSFLISKLVIRETVYGFILLCKKEKKFYTPQDLELANILGSIVSYKIKDIELSDVFKTQLKALTENVVDTKTAYKTIKEQNLKILEADKVKNEFLANISHELRTPLNAIIGFSEVLANGFYGKLNEKQADYVNDINISGIHLLEMINEILDISKIEANAMSLHKSVFLIPQAVSEVVNVVKSLADKKSIKIDQNITETSICADFQKIKQILYNLLSNAIKFSPENSKIFITAKKEQNNFIIEVKDNGIGIDKKDQEKIFDKFVQLENAYTKKESSTGLGLTITKQLVEMHGGKIAVKSALGKGTTFIASIPVSK